MGAREIEGERIRQRVKGRRKKGLNGEIEIWGMGEASRGKKMSYTERQEETEP